MWGEDAQTRALALKHIFGSLNTTVLKCAVELQIPEILEKHGGPMSLSELSSAVGCPSSSIYRIMRFLSFQGVFKKIKPAESPENAHYVQTPLSRLFMRDKMGPIMLLHFTPPPTHQGFSIEALRSGSSNTVFNSEDRWAESICHEKFFIDGMDCHARNTTETIIVNYGERLRGISSLVDVGGSRGMAVGMLVEALPWIKGICFDLPETVSEAPTRKGVEFVGGNMFESVPKADAVMLMSVLHNWSDEMCIEALKKCKEAVPFNTGKVIIVESIIDEDDEGDEFTAARLELDMVMMGAKYEGKERTYTEWVRLLDTAGFTKHSVINIKTIESVIEACP